MPNDFEDSEYGDNGELDWLKVGLAAVLFIFAFGFAGAEDYKAERIAECASKNRDYDEKRDLCVKPTPTTNRAKEH